MTIAKPLLLLALLACGPVHAHHCPDDWRGDADLIQPEMNHCAQQEYMKADREMNRLYAGYRARLDDGQRAMLTKAQRAWIAFRELACEFETSSSRGGSIRPLLMAQCREEKTRARIRELRRLDACQETDMSCPLPAGG